MIGVGVSYCTCVNSKSHLSKGGGILVSISLRSYLFKPLPDARQPHIISIQCSLNSRKFDNMLVFSESATIPKVIAFLD